MGIKYRWQPVKNPQQLYYRMGRLQVINLNDNLTMEIASICLYRGVLKDRAVQSLITLLRLINDDRADAEGMVEAWCGVQTVLLYGEAPDFYEHVTRITMNDENPFTLRCEKHEINMEGPLVRQAVSDLSVLEKLASISCDWLKRKMKNRAAGLEAACRLIDKLPVWNRQTNIPLVRWEKAIQERVLWHEQKGAGIFSESIFFIWDGEKEALVPVKNPDPITLDKLYLIDHQKDVTIKNTKTFLSGMPANNVLFYGDRGTGKSSLVKALANEFCGCGLRLVEVPKNYLGQIPRITSVLSERGLKFVLFIDDLAFENNEEKYTALKAVLEGGLEHKPSNILLYATSNRRHLVKETFADRQGISSDNPDEEIRARDSIQEKLSLADRFGITIVFSAPIKKEYLQLVHKMAEEEDIFLEKSLLEQKAMQWEMTYNGMSARTARQFITWLKAQREL